VRDGLSLSIRQYHSGSRTQSGQNNGANMLGPGRPRERVIDLFERTEGRKGAEALAELNALYDRGADRGPVVQEL